MKIHEFTDDDRRYRGFRSFQESLEKRLQDLREKNDKRLTEGDTAELRGRIDEIKSLLKDMQPNEPKELRPKTIPYA